MSKCTCGKNIATAPLSEKPSGWGWFHVFDGSRACCDRETESKESEFVAMVAGMQQTDEGDRDVTEIADDAVEAMDSLIAKAREIQATMEVKP